MEQYSRPPQQQRPSLHSDFQPSATERRPAYNIPDVHVEGISVGPGCWNPQILSSEKGRPIVGLKGVGGYSVQHTHVTSIAVHPPFRIQDAEFVWIYL